MSTYVGVTQYAAKVADPDVLTVLVPPVQPVKGYQSHRWRRTCFGCIFQITEMVLGSMAVGLRDFQIADDQSPQRDRSYHLLYTLATEPFVYRVLFLTANNIIQGMHVISKIKKEKLPQ